MSDAPESSGAADQPSAPDTAGPDSQTVESPAGEPMSRSPLLWLVAGLITAIVVPIAVQAALARQPALSQEHEQLANNMSRTDEEDARLMELLNEVNNGQQQELTIATGASVAVVFGLFAGIIHRHLAMGVIGALVGVGVAFGLSLLSSQPILDLQANARGQGGDTSAMIMHALQWIVIGLAGTAAVLVGSMRLLTGIKGLGALLLSAVLGAVIYVVVGALIDPASRTANAAPAEGIPRYLWTSVPPLVAGLMMARSKRQ